MGVWSSLISFFSPPPPAPAPPPLVDPPEPPKPVLRPEMALDSVSAQFMLEALSRMGTAPSRDGNANPFDALKVRPPPGVGRGGPAMAMDDATFGGVAAWAYEGLAGFLGPREGFIGFPELALLAQIPEYRSPVEIIATEATRKWIKIHSAGAADKSEKIKRIEAEFKRLNVQAAFRQVSEHDGFYGRGHIYLDTGDTDNPDELMKPIGSGSDALSKFKLGKGSLKAIRSLEPWTVWPIAYNSTDPLNDKWYRPETWYVMSKGVHKTRLLTFIAREVPDLLKPAYMFGGQSLTQKMRPVVENWLSTRKAVGEIVKRFSHNVIKVKLTEAINSGNASALFQRVAFFNQAKTNLGTMVLDNESEDFVNVSAPLSGLDLLQAQAQEHMSSLSRIPIIKLLGIQPAGLNATSEGELRAFEEMIHSYQESFFRPNLTVVFNVVQASLFGEVDPDLGFDFVPMAEDLPAEQAAAAAQQANNGVVSAFEAGIIDRATALPTLLSGPPTMAVFPSLESATE
jgi:phage-related protein (TIGR01555 family)